MTRCTLALQLVGTVVRLEIVCHTSGQVIIIHRGVTHFLLVDLFLILVVPFTSICLL